MNETERAYKIGKAACDGHPTITDHWDSLDEILQSSWIDEGLAAVAEARRLDTCETCEHYDGGNFANGWYKQCNMWDFKPDAIGCEGCNRHQVKEG